LKVVIESLDIPTSREGEVLNITEKVEDVLRRSAMSDGLATVFVAGSTAAITITEFEDGLTKDIPSALERIAPRLATYEHQRAYHDDNGHSHVRSSLIGPGLSVPFSGGKLLLGTWQSIVLIELDIRPRVRRIHVQVIGE
jgi:secondary thiamine-phosphate synthase enzyme